MHMQAVNLRLQPYMDGGSTLATSKSSTLALVRPCACPPVPIQREPPTSGSYRGPPVAWPYSGLPPLHHCPTHIHHAMPATRHPIQLHTPPPLLLHPHALTRIASAGS